MEEVARDVDMKQKVAALSGECPTCGRHLCSSTKSSSLWPSEGTEETPSGMRHNPELLVEQEQ